MSRLPITLHSPAHIDPNRQNILDLHRLGAQMSHSQDVLGGFYRGSLRLQGDYHQLESIFANRLGYEVREWWGKSWCGLIREMALVHGGATETVSLDHIANAVVASYEYTDEEDAKQTADTAVTENPASIARYGRYEKRIDTRLSGTEAEARRDTYLTAHAWPTPALTSLRLGGRDQSTAELSIELTGFSYELRGRYFDINGEITAERNTLSELVTFIATEGGFELGQIADNPLTWSQETNDNALAVLTQICELGDTTARPWRWWIDKDRQLHYQPLSQEVKYYLVNGGLRLSNNRPVAGQERTIAPGIVRRMGTFRASRPGHWLTDGRDFYATRVEVSADNELSLSTAEYDEFALLEAQADIQRIEEDKV
jgi:hypothetical protein